MSSATLCGLDIQTVLDALASPIRREIVWLLWDRELAAGEIAAEFDLTAPTISAHLAVLRDAGLVVMRRDGNFRRYRAERTVLASVQQLIDGEATKWIPNPVQPEPDAVEHDSDRVVRVSVTVPVPVGEAFTAFTDSARYSAWLGMPVSIVDGRFSATMEWGLGIRGYYDVVAPPQLIALRWDFAPDSVPLPGQELIGYMRFSPVPDGTRIEVQQLVVGQDQDDYMQLAWGFVLGRYLESTGNA